MSPRQWGSAEAVMGVVAANTIKRTSLANFLITILPFTAGLSRSVILPSRDLSAPRGSGDPASSNREIAHVKDGRNRGTWHAEMHRHRQDVLRQKY
jgi:hypothetical protein